MNTTIIAFLLGAAGAWYMAARAHTLGLIDRPNERIAPRGTGTFS